MKIVSYLDGRKDNVYEAELLSHYFEYGIEDDNGEETITLGHRFYSLSEAMEFCAWYFHGAAMTDGVRRWLDGVDREEANSV